MGLKNYAEEGRLYTSAMDRAEALEREHPPERACKSPETPTRLRIVLEIEDPAQLLPSLLGMLKSSPRTPPEPRRAPAGCWTTDQ